MLAPVPVQLCNHCAAGRGLKSCLRTLQQCSCLVIKWFYLSILVIGFEPWGFLVGCSTPVCFTNKILYIMLNSRFRVVELILCHALPKRG